MPRRTTQRELRNESGRAMRELDKGRSFIVTRNGVAVGELSPVRQRAFVPADAVKAAFASEPRIDRARFRRDVDAVIDQDAIPAPEARPPRGFIHPSVVIDLPRNRG